MPSLIWLWKLQFTILIFFTALYCLPGLHFLNFMPSLPGLRWWRCLKCCTCYTAYNAHTACTAYTVVTAAFACNGQCWAVVGCNGQYWLVMACIGGSKSFGTHITENHLGTSLALFFGRAGIKWAKNANFWPKMSILGQKSVFSKKTPKIC